MTRIREEEEDRAVNVLHANIYYMHKIHDNVISLCLLHV